MQSNQRPSKLRKGIPQIIILALVLVVCLYILFEIVEDASLANEPFIGAIFSLSQSITTTISSWGYIGVFILMLLESSSLPVPSEAVLPFAGFFVSQGSLDFWLTVIVATVAGVLGSLIDYYIGLKGVHILTDRKILGRAIFSMDQIENAAKWFNKYGSFMVFIGRLVPAFRTLISFPAGAVRMPIVKFIVYTTAGCLIWNTILVYLGFFLGSNWNEVAGVSHYIVIAVVIIAVIILTVYFTKRRMKNKKKPAC